MEVAVKTSVIEVTEALAQIGLTKEILRDAILRGEAGRDSCTANDAPGAPGFYAWAGTVRGLRDILTPRGWTRNDDVNYSRVINPDKSIAIAVVTGDEGTGNKDVSPRGPNIRKVLLLKPPFQAISGRCSSWNLL